MNRCRISLLLAVLALVAAPAAANAVSAESPLSVSTSGRVQHAGSPASAATSGLTPLGGSPSYPIANPKTHTLYVALQCRISTPGACPSHKVEHVLDVINTKKCKLGASCKIIARAAAGQSPLAEAIDFKTDTIYVGDAPGTVTVVNGARCNATVTSGCDKPLATIKTGGFIVALAFDPRTRTVYVANASPKGGVFVIDAAKCSAETTKGCGRPVREIKDSLGPDGIALDIASDTIYAANSGPGNGDTVSVIDGATCNASHAGGCGQTPRTVKVGPNPFWDVVDQATNTVYVANHGSGNLSPLAGTVSVINGATCNAKITSGCHGFRAVPTGANVAFLVVDDSRHTVFAINQGDNTLSEINTNTCNGKVASGCRRRARNEGTRFNPPQGENPGAFALIPRTGMAYLVSPGSEGFLGAVSIKHCSAEDTSGCRVEAPAIREHEYLFSVDRATNTIYASNLNRPQIDVIKGATCNASDLSGCKPVAEIPMANNQANVGAIDDATHTLYASNPYGNTVSVINLAHCKATDTTGCSAVQPALTVSGGPGQPALDKGTHTLYVPDGAPNFNQVAVVNAATCNAEHTSGCGQTATQVPVGNGTFVLAVSAAKDTVYAAASGFGSGHTVDVINGASCNATHHAGCAHPVATVDVGPFPVGLAANDPTHTLYVANNASSELPGTLSIIDTTTCNGSHTAGCAGHKPTVAVGRGPAYVAVDSTSDTIYIADESSAAVSVLDGAACRAGHTGGCATAVHTQPVGSVPQQPVVSQATHSVYAANIFSPQSVSIFKISP